MDSRLPAGKSTLTPVLPVLKPLTVELIRSTEEEKDHEITNVWALQKPATR
jgi:hypothetical protein